MTWQGRQLTKTVKGKTTIKYTYDADGLRASKTAGKTNQTFQYLGGKLMYENRGDGKEFYCSYDANGNLACIRYYIRKISTKWCLFISFWDKCQEKTINFFETSKVPILLMLGYFNYGCRYGVVAINRRL